MVQATDNAVLNGATAMGMKNEVATLTLETLMESHPTFNITFFSPVVNNEDQLSVIACSKNVRSSSHILHFNLQSFPQNIKYVPDLIHF